MRDEFIFGRMFSKFVAVPIEAGEVLDLCHEVVKRLRNLRQRWLWVRQSGQRGCLPVSGGRRNKPVRIIEDLRGGDLRETGCIRTKDRRAEIIVLGEFEPS